MYIHCLAPKATAAACHLLAAFLCCAHATTATFVMQDRTTQGNWVDTYAPNFLVPGLATFMPANVQVSTNGAQFTLWAARTNLPGALLKPLPPGETNGTALDRHAAAWTATSNFSLLIERPNTVRRLAIYCLDVGSGGTRSQRVDLVDTNTGAILLDNLTGQPCSLTVSGFTNGIYAVWESPALCGWMSRGWLAPARP